MLTEREHDALRQWYSQPKILDESRKLVEGEEWEDLEEHLQMRCLFALSRHSELPDYMRDDDGNPLFPTNLNPGNDLERWRDGIEVAWEVVQREFNLSHDDLHRMVATEQKADWDEFMERAKKRFEEKGL